MQPTDNAGGKRSPSRREAIFGTSQTTRPLPLKNTPSSETFTNEADVPASTTSTTTHDFARSCNTAFIYASGQYRFRHGFREVDRASVRW